jgi:hypothetical protein
LNFEAIYSELNEDPRNLETIKTINDKLYDYFRSVEIPDQPTIYDYLILSLRRKDAIATFNWDPLLVQAYMRAQDIIEQKKLPRLIFLHGNVMIGKCDVCRTAGIIFNRCSKCGKRFSPTQLLFPVKQKDYENDIFVKDSWHDVRIFFKDAFSVTIFGYSAPDTDQGAMRLFGEAWGNKEKRNMEEFEIIDIKSEEEVTKAWDSFIHTHHYLYSNNFYDSQIAHFPRRSIEALFERLLEGKALANHKLPLKADFATIRQHINKLVEIENNIEKGNKK